MRRVFIDKRNTSGVVALGVVVLIGCAEGGQGVVVSGDAHTSSVGIVEGNEAAYPESEPSRRGFLTRTYVDDEGQHTGYVVFVPHAGRAGERLPVLMFLNGVGEAGRDGVRQISNNFGVQVWEMQEFFPFLAVCPQGRREESWNSSGFNAQSALSILDSVISEYNGDPDRVYLTGVSDGGAGVWAVGSAHAERFAGLVPLCGGAGGTDFQPLLDARMPIWMFYNDGDRQERVAEIRKNRAALIRRGASPLLTLYRASGHDCWNNGYRTTALFGWLLEQSRTSNERQPLFKYIPPAEVLQTWTQAGSANWSVDRGDEVLRGNAGGGESLLVSPGFAGTFEAHGDVWLPQDSPREISLLANGAAGEDVEFRVRVMLPDQGSGGIVRASDGAWLAEIDLAAQHWLKEDGWNDVRLCCDDGRLSVRLNGWPAVDADLGLGGGSGEQVEYRVALVPPPDGSEVRWRYLRTRELKVSSSVESQGQE